MTTPSSGSSSSIKVAVRCRPLNAREIARGAKCLIRMNGNQTILEAPDTVGNHHDGGDSKAPVHGAGRSHAFTFDHSYWSAGDREDEDYASQQTLFDDLGRDLLDHAFQGYNVSCCTALCVIVARQRTWKADLQ
jgi:kinesin family protein 1